jgi:transcription termination factor Rho
MYSHMVDPPNGGGMDAVNATEALLQRFSRTENNMEFLETLTEEK